MFVVINPSGVVPYASSKDDPVPPCNPFDPAKETIVFVHASAMSSALFSAQFADPRLARAYNLVGLDARLHGRTTGADLTKKEHTVEDSAGCIMAVLDALDLPRYAVLGEGFHGSCVAAWLAIKRPAKVTCILLASPGFHTESQDNREGLAQLLPLLLSNKDGKGDKTGALAPEGATAAMQYFLGGRESARMRREEHTAALKLRYGAGHSSHGIIHMLNWANRTPIPPNLLASIAVPVLILQGSEDTVVSPPAASEEWRRSLCSVPGGADVRLIQGAPHLLCFTDYNIVNRFLAGFVAKSTADFKQ